MLLAISLISSLNDSGEVISVCLHQVDPHMVHVELVGTPHLFSHLLQEGFSLFLYPMGEVGADCIRGVSGMEWLEGGKDKFTSQEDTACIGVGRANKGQPPPSGILQELEECIHLLPVVLAKELVHPWVGVLE